MKIALEAQQIDRKSGGITLVANVKSSLPFIKSTRGEYTHRVRSAVSYTYTTSGISYKAGELHIAVKCWCNMTLLVSKRKYGRFIPEPIDGSPICATCEGRAIGAGLLGTPEIAGRPVKYSPMGKLT